MNEPNDTAPQPMGDDESAKITGGYEPAGGNCPDCELPYSQCECTPVLSVQS